MKIIHGLLVVFILTGCSDVHKPGNKKIALKATVNKTPAADTVEKPIIQYSDQQLESFLDSVGHLPEQPLADKAGFGADSIFRNQLQLDGVVSPKDLKILIHAAHKGVIAVKTARRIFRNKHISTSCTEKSIFLTYRVGLTPVVYYPFDVSKGEYAICIGDPSHCESAYLYFFKGNRVIAVHDFYDRFSPGLKYFKDGDGRTVVYYAKMFEEGTGIWWFNYYFYKYDGNKLMPVLNELQNANLLQPSPSNWGLRQVWLESFIQKTSPLTIKMVYHQDLRDTLYRDSDKIDSTSGVKIVNDSTIVRYRWNERTKSFQGQYQESKISKEQILSYYLVDNELLFINAHYKTLKGLLLDKTKRKSTLNYLNKIKNYCCKK